MSALCSKKVLRPKLCNVLDGKSCAACIEDVKLEKEIKKLEIMIEKIHIRRRALRTVMNENHDHLIHKFPPEIASHIFMQYSPRAPSEFLSKSTRINPLYLGAVCQKWRHLAWATPGLWATLRISPGHKDIQPQLVTEWLQRSASLPLTIKLADYSGWISEHEEIINILNEHSARWHDMCFDIPALHLHQLYGSSQGNILRRLVLRQPSWALVESQFSVFSMKSKPTLTHLTLLTVGLPYVDIEWNNLTVASVGNISIDQCLELIRRTPLLESLTLQTISPSSNVFPTPNTRIVHPHLHFLNLWGIIDETVVVEILDSLCLPSLERWTHSQSPLPLVNMLSFAQAGCLSSCLKRFEIHLPLDTMTSHKLVQLLSHLPSLEFLGLRDHSFNSELFRPLGASALNSPLFLAHLQCLEIGCGTEFPWNSLPHMFSPASWWRSFKLRMVVYHRLKRLEDLGEQTVKKLMELVDNGIDLSIVDSDEVDLVQAYQEELH